MTVASSSSSDSQTLRRAGGGRTADSTDGAPPSITVRDLGVWYRLHRRRTPSIKRALLSGRLSQKTEQFWALRHIDFECREGQVLGIVGHNGAGKSTLCLALARILTPDEGEAIVRGSITPLLTLGSTLNRQLTGRENIFLYASFLGIRREVIVERMDEIIDFSGLGDFIDQPVLTYSSGMQSRLSFSVAAILEPEILILDEVLGTGDRAFRARSRSRILEMMQQSRIIAIVSHSIGFLREVCTHGLWLDRGRQRMFGNADEVLDAYEKGGDPAS